MSFINFIADAGEKLLAAATGMPAAPSTSPSQSNVARLNATAGAAIAKYIASQNLSAQNLNVVYDGATKTVTVSGVAPDQATKEKIILCCGNVHSVAKVDDRLTVVQASGSSLPAASLYEVKEGDTLSKIAKSIYGDANSYEKIFEANEPMLKDPNKIYPGQQLRIPPKA
jgi:nucleoid-associated protein YgaU